MLKPKHLALLSYLIVCIVWGSTYLAIKIGVTDMPVVFFVGVRFTSAGCLILIISRLCGWSFPRSRQDYRTAIGVGLFMLGVSNGMICWAEQWLESGLTALLVATIPLFMAAIENVSPRGQRTGRLGWLGLGIGFAGVATLVSPELSLEGHTFPAMLVVLASSLNWTIGSVYLKRHPIRGAIMPSVGIQMLSAGIPYLLLSIMLGNFSFSGVSSRGIASIFYLVFMGSIVAYSAFNYMIKAMPAAKAGTYAYVNPVVAIILGALVLREQVTVQTVLAAAIILGGVVLVQVSRTVPAPAADLSPEPDPVPVPEAADSFSTRS